MRPRGSPSPCKPPFSATACRAATSSARRTTAARAGWTDMGRPLSRLRCTGCGRDYPLDEIRYECDACSSLLEVAHDLDRLKKGHDGASWRRLFESRLGASDGLHRSGVWRYHELVLPDLPPEHVVSKPEGNTNLYRS